MWSTSIFTLLPLFWLLASVAIAKRCTFQDEAKIVNCSYNLVNSHFLSYSANDVPKNETNETDQKHFDVNIEQTEAVCQRYDQYLKCVDGVSDKCRERSLPNLVPLWEFLCSKDIRQKIVEEKECFTRIENSSNFQKCFDKNKIDVNDARYESHKLCASTQMRFKCFSSFDNVEKCQEAVKIYQSFFAFLSQNFSSPTIKSKLNEDEKFEECSYQSIEKMIEQYKAEQAEKAIGGCVEVKVNDENGNVTIKEECHCIDGYKINSTTNKCVDINECVEGTHNCAQICKNKKGSYDCACNRQYGFYETLDTDNRTCVRKDEKNESVRLIFAHGQSIWNVSNDGKFVELKLSGLMKTAMLDLDLKENVVYFVDSGKNLVEKLSLQNETAKPEVIQNYEVDGAEGIAVDYMARNLYLARKSDIFVQTLDGKYRRRLYKNKLSTPRALIVYPEQGLLFGSDWSSEAFIYRATTDGSHLEKIITKDIVWPNGLAVDHFASKLYWADAFLDVIESTNFDGTERRKIVANSGAVAHLFGLAIADNYIYWTDWNHRGILRADKNTGKNITLLAQTTLLPYGIKVHNSVAQPGLRDSASPCSKANCSHLCLLSKNGTAASCACADGYSLTSDGNTCEANCREPEENVVVCGGSEPKCVSKRYVCDGILHCPDRVDEQNCPERICPLGEFQCVDDPKKCISSAAVCDGQKQCKDGSDERYCSLKKQF